MELICLQRGTFDVHKNIITISTKVTDSVFCHQMETWQYNAQGHYVYKYGTSITTELTHKEGFENCVKLKASADPGK